MRLAMQNCVTEFSLVSGKNYNDPFNEIIIDVAVKGPDGQERVIPAFWSGDNVWRVRFSSPVTGRHHYRTTCSDASNLDLHGRERVIEVTPYTGANKLLKHGPPRVSADRRHLEHTDGTPFFWLADTWWMGLVKRLKWPEDFQLLAADRVAKGFTVIQIVAGLYPDMFPFDERGANEAGFPWEKDYSRINPAYFDMADLRIGWLVSSGLTPCIVGCWGYFLTYMGVEKMKRHWRNLVARYGAYPVIWCLAGEGIMPFYLSTEKEKEKEFQKKGWTELASYVRRIDPFNRPSTIHPMDRGSRSQLEDPSLVDIDMLATGHYDRLSIPTTVNRVVDSYGEKHRMPVINGEVCYEGIMGVNWQDVQRFVFWSCLLSGAAGHTYGADGVWQVNTKDIPFGPSPHGACWGNTSWEESYRLPGSSHLGIGKQLLQRYEWWRFEPHPEWAEPCWNQENYFLPYAAGIPGEVRFIFIPAFSSISFTDAAKVKVKGIEPGVNYRAFYFDPKNAAEYQLGDVTPDEEGTWLPPRPTIFQDWVLVLELQQ